MVIFLVRKLGAAPYGILAVGLSFVSLILELSDLGLNGTAIRLGSEYYKKGEVSAFSGLMTSLLLSRLLIFSVFIFGVFFSDLFFDLDFFKKISTQMILLSLLGGGFLLLQTYVNSLLVCLQKFKAVTFSNAIIGVGNLFLVFFLFGIDRLSPLRVISIIWIPPLLSTIFAWFQLNPELRKLSWPNSLEVNRFLKIAIGLSLAALFQVLLSRSDLFMLTEMSTLEEVGRYSAHFRLSRMTMLLPSLFGIILGPRLMGSLEKTESRRRIQQFFWSAALSVLIVIGMIILRNLVIELTLGTSYIESSDVLLFLLMGWIATIFGQVLFQMMVFNEKTKPIAIGTFFALILNVGLNYLWIPQRGALGAAQSFLLSSICTTAFLIFFVIRLKKSNISL
tara:strand:- start:8590 stop:9768 length:1179 start_codon:yes stop_codon:yes gene_type:complete